MRADLAQQEHAEGVDCFQLLSTLAKHLKELENSLHLLPAHKVEVLAFGVASGPAPLSSKCYP